MCDCEINYPQNKDRGIVSVAKEAAQLDSHDWTWLENFITN